MGAYGGVIAVATMRCAADDHSTLHHSIGPAIDALAGSLAKGTNSAVDGQNESLSVHTSSIAAAEGVIGVNTSQVVAR